MGKIGAITMGLVFSAITMGLPGCNRERKPDFPRSEGLLSEFIADTSNRVAEIASGWRKGGIGYADSQSSLDSAGYRNIFNGTQAAKDSGVVAEFNSIASKNRIPEYIRTDAAANLYLSRKIRFSNLTVGDWKQMKSYIGVSKNKNDSADIVKKQFITDSIAYNRFLEKHNLRNDAVVKKIRRISKKIKP